MIALKRLYSILHGFGKGEGGGSTLRRHHRGAISRGSRRGTRLNEDGYNPRRGDVLIDGGKRWWGNVYVCGNTLRYRCAF